MERPYLDLTELSDIFGMTRQSILNATSRGTFPVPTYKIGKQRVADKRVVTAYFERHAGEGMAFLQQK